MTSPLDGTRVGEMFDSLTAGVTENTTPEEISDRMASGIRMVYAAMGAEYLLLCAKTGLRPPLEALKHWLEFCALSNHSVFGSVEKMNAFRPILRACLKDMQDIRAGKIQ